MDKPLGGIEIITVESKLLRWMYRLLRINDQNSTGKEDKPARQGPIRRFVINRGIGILGRMPDLSMFWIRPCLKHVGARKWDIVISSFGPYSCHEIAKKLHQRGQAKHWIADFRDLWTASHQYSGLFPFTLLEHRKEKKVIDQADVLTTVSSELSEYFESRYGRLAHTIETGFDKDDYPAVAPVAKPSSSGELLIAYTGTLYPDYSMISELLLELHDLNTSNSLANVKFQFMGADLSEFASEIRRLKLDSVVSYVGPKTRSQALELQRKADLLIIFDSEKAPGVTTGKIYEYLNSGKPIWRIGGLDHSAMARILKTTNTGLDTAGRSIREVLIALLDRSIQLQIEPDREKIESLECHNLAGRFLRTLEDLKD